MAPGKKTVKYGRIGIKLAVFLMALWISGRGSMVTVRAFDEKEVVGNGTESSEESEFGQAVRDMGISEELEQLEQYLNRFLGEDGNRKTSVSFTDLMKAFASGNLGEFGRTVKEGAGQLLLSQVREGAGLLTQAAAIGLLGAMFSGAASVFKNGQISDTGFYVAYLLLFVCLAGSFLASLSIAAEVLDRILEFMGVLMPAYFMAVSFSGGNITGICMYEAMMAAVFCVQWLSKSVFLTGVRVYVLLVLGSHVMKEPLLSKMTSLTEQAVEWGIKTMFGLILGLHVLEAMVLPYADNVGRSGLLKLAEAVPGLGAGSGAAARMVLGSGVLIKNTMGAAGVTVLALIALLPAAKLLTLALFYQAAGAIMQPVCDKRMVSCVIGVSRGHRLLLKIVLYSLLLFVIAIAVTCKAADVAYLSV